MSGWAGYELGPIRPPSEAASLLIRMTRNCPWNRCSFCPVYKGARFELRDIEDVKQDVRTARRLLGDRFRSAFLQDADSLAAPAEDVAQVIRLIRESFPRVRRVTSYSRSATLFKRSPEELARLRQAGLDRIHVGLESGSKAVLRLAMKGVSPRIHIEAGRRVKDAGLELSEYVMPGLGGKEHTREHAVETAAVLNGIDPDFIRLRTLFIVPGSPLAAAVAAGSFQPLSEDETVEEIRLLLDSLDGIRSRVVSDHSLNLLMELEGRLPEDRPRLLDVVDRYLELGDRDRLLFRLGRRLGVLRRLDQLEPARERLEATLGELERRQDIEVESFIDQLLGRCI